MTEIPAYILANGGYESAVQKIVIPKTVKEIGGYAFYKCTGITEISLPEELTEIGSDAFSKCTGLKNVDVPKKVSKIWDSAFSDCTGLKSVTMTYNEALTSEGKPYSLEIGKAAFSNCSELETVQLSENVTKIGNYAFEDCTTLKELVLPESIKALGYCMIKGTGISSITIPKNVKESDWYSAYNAGYNGALAGAGYLKEVVFESGMTEIPNYILASGGYTSNVEKVLIPETVTSIGSNAFYNCTKMTIYGLPGSYAETFANNNSIPFEDISGFRKGFYRNADYTVKVVDAATGYSLSNALITIQDGEQYYTDEKGIAKITTYGTTTQKVDVSKDGYETTSYSGWPWKANGVNTVRLKRKLTMEEQVISMTPEISLSGDKLKGPEIKVLGYTFNLFETDVSFKLPLFDNMVVKQDTENKTIKVLLGFNGKYSAKLEAADADDTYWSESYQQVKSLVKGCGGKVDTTKLWNQFSSIRGQLKEIDGTAAIHVGGKTTGFIEFSYANGNLEIVDGGLVAMLEAGTSIKAPLFWCVYEEFGLGGQVDGELNFNSSAEKKFLMSGNIGLSLTPSVALGAGGMAGFDIKGGVEGTLAGKMSFPADNMRDALSVTMSGKLFIKTNGPVPILCYSKDWDLGSVELYPNFGAYLEASDWKLAVDDRVMPGEGEVYEYADPHTVSLSDGRKVKVYIDDDGTKSTGNHTTLMYQVYENGSWSAAKAVCETGRADSSPILYAYGNKAYVAWLNINKLIDTDTSAEDIYAHTDLYFAEFNGTAFGQPELVSDTGNQKLEFNYAETADSNNQVVAWVENSQNDPFMQNGTNTIYVKTRTGNTWGKKQKLCTTEDKIWNLEVLLNNGQITAYYSDDTRNYSVSGGSVFDIGEGSSTKVFDGRLFYLENSTLHEKTDTETIDYGIVCNSDYQIMDGVVYWTVSTGYTSELFMQKLENSEPVQLTYDNAYVGRFTLTKDSSGQVIIEYVSTDVDVLNTSSPYGKSHMKTLTGTGVYDLACGNISYDAKDIQPGKEVEFKVQITNYSSVAVKNIKMRVTGKNNTTIMNQVVLDSLEAGKSQEVAFKYTLPSAVSGLTIKAEVYADGIEEVNKDNDSDTCTFNSTDIQIVSADKDKVVIKNNGYTAAKDVKIGVYEGDSNGILINEQTVGTLQSGESLTQNIIILSKYLQIENYEDTKLFTIKVSSSTEETLLADNEYLLQIEPPHVTGISLDQTEMTLSKGDKKKLNTKISAETGADTTVFWNSSDKDVATVDEQGNVMAVDAGTATITVMTLDGDYSAECEVEVAEDIEKLATVEMIAAKDTGKASINVRWKSVDGAEGYRIYRKFTGSSWKVLTEVGADQLSYADSSGVTGKTYSYTVQAYKTVNGQEIVGEYNAAGVTATKLPAAVVLKEAKSNGKDGIDISWNKVSNADGYQIYRKPVGGSWSKLAKVESNTTLTYTDKTVVSGTTYHYTVRAYKNYDGKMVLGGYDNKGVTAVFNDTSTTLGTVVLDKAADSTKGSIIISWKAEAGAEGYRIFRKFTGSSWQKVTDVAADKLSYEDSSGVTGKTYTYTVRAFKKVNGKEIFGGFDSKGLTATKLPAKVTLRGAEADDNGAIIVSWNKLSTATGYRVFRKDAGGSWKGIITLTANTAVSYTDKSVTPGKSYTYTVRAYKVYNGKMVYGSFDEKGKTAEAVISAPNQVKLISATASSGRKITVSWEKTDNAEGYVVYRKKAGKSWTRIAKAAGSSLSSYTDASGTAGTTYTYTVRAYKTMGGKEVLGSFDTKGVSATCKN